MRIHSLSLTVTFTAYDDDALSNLEDAKLAATWQRLRVGAERLSAARLPNLMARWKAGLFAIRAKKIEIVMGNRLYVGNLSYQATSESLRDAFSACGEVTDVHIVQDRDSGQSRGFGFVTMGSASEASAAIAQLDGSSLDGRSLRVNEAEERQNTRGGGGGGGGGGGRRGGGGGGGGGGGRW